MASLTVERVEAAGTRAREALAAAQLALAHVRRLLRRRVRDERFLASGEIGHCTEHECAVVEGEVGENGRVVAAVIEERGAEGECHVRRPRVQPSHPPNLLPSHSEGVRQHDAQKRRRRRRGHVEACPLQERAREAGTCAEEQGTLGRRAVRQVVLEPQESRERARRALAKERCSNGE